MKTSVLTPEDFEKFKLDCTIGIGNTTGWIAKGIESLRPSHYPAVISWCIENLSSGLHSIDGDIIYLSDFDIPCEINFQIALNGFSLTRN